MKELLSQIKAKMQAAFDHLLQELKLLRTGRANPGMVEHVQVEVYGTQMRLAEVATITAPEALQLLVTPFDPKNAAQIGKSLEKANLNLQVVVDGNVVRLRVPPMDTGRRQEMVKEAKKRGEETKVQIRNLRREGNDKVRKQKGTTFTEDEVKRAEKEIQELTDSFCEKADAQIAAKEKEILTV